MNAKPESMNQTKVVPPVEEKTRTSVKEPSIVDLAAGIPQEKADMAEKLGIPITAILNYMKYQEDKLKAVINSMPTKDNVKTAMTEWAVEAQKNQAAQYQQNVAAGQPQQGGGMGDFVPMLKQFMGSGGEDNEMAALTKEMFKMNIEGMKQDIGFTKALKSAMLSKYATGLVKDVVP